ncbi:MAG TPA: hypothetical protein VN706_09915 [Gemmatimonadaceae bacterium]|nr:hypothetical protein [Gemmatimonadaceae bacterium]
MRRILLSLAVASVFACAKDAPMAPNAVIAPDAVIGQYNIATVDGFNLPMQIGQQGSTGVDVLAGALELEEDASFRDIVTIRTRGAGGVKVYVDTVVGSFLHFQNTLLLTPRDGSSPTFLDVTDDKTLTSWDFDVIVYRR